MSDRDSMGPQRHNAPRGISFHRHSARTEKLGFSGSKGDGHLTDALPSAATRVGATAKAPSDIVELWTTTATPLARFACRQSKAAPQGAYMTKFADYA
jgi:hypothetical protein